MVDPKLDINIDTLPLSGKSERQNSQNISPFLVSSLTSAVMEEVKKQNTSTTM